MPTETAAAEFDVAIVGGGPAGLSAAVLLGRARRRVLLFDHGRPRNYAARAVHGYLGLDGIAPAELRARGREEALKYGAQILDQEVVDARNLDSGGHGTCFELQTAGGTYQARKLLLATGMIDQLPDIRNLEELYGRSVHHCPYCDGWEHREKRLVAYGQGSSAVKLALTLRTWSPHVTACTNGHAISSDERDTLEANGIACRSERVLELEKHGDGRLRAVLFENGPPLECEALFFSADMGQCSDLAKRLGCGRDDRDLIPTENKQQTCIEGIYLAGDADGDVQFAIVAAAEGAIAATAINTALQEEDERLRAARRRAESAARRVT